MTQNIIHIFVWLRVIGDTIFSVGALALGWFILGLKTGWSLTDQPLPYADDNLQKT
ncbi:hypothetical protein [Brevibacillus sp. NL20B1]|nr:hypothetical protein [Brevibacillus sp. NL20B1]